MPNGGEGHWAGNRFFFFVLLSPRSSTSTRSNGTGREQQAEHSSEDREEYWVTAYAQNLQHGTMGMPTQKTRGRADEEVT